MTISTRNPKLVGKGRKKMKITYQQQRRAIREAIKALQKELSAIPYDDVTKNDLIGQVEALKEAVTSLDRLEQLAQLLGKILQ